MPQVKYFPQSYWTFLPTSGRDFNKPVLPTPYQGVDVESECGTKVTHSVIFSALLVKVGRWGGRISFNYEISVTLVVISVTW